MPQMVNQGTDAEPDFMEKLENDITEKFKKEVEKRQKDVENQRK